MNRNSILRAIGVSLALLLAVAAVGSSPVLAKKPIPGAMGNWHFDWRGKADSQGSGSLTLTVVTITSDGYSGTLSGSGTDNDGNSYSVTGTWNQTKKKLSGMLSVSGAFVYTDIPWTANIAGNGGSMTMKLKTGQDTLTVKLDQHVM
jgi:hypothetical protein